MYIYIYIHRVLVPNTKKKQHQMEKNWENKTIKIKRKRKNSQESNKFGYFESHWICVLFVAKIPYKEADYIIITGSFFFIFFFFFSLLNWFSVTWLYQLNGYPFEWFQHQTFKRPYSVDSNYRADYSISSVHTYINPLENVQRKAKAI